MIRSLTHPQAVDWSRPIALGLAVAGLLGIGYGLFLGIGQYAAVDFANYTASIHRFLDGLGLYDPGQLAGPYVLARAEGLQVFDYPPPAIFLIGPLALIGYVPFTALSLGTLFAGLLAIARPLTPIRIGLVAALGLALPTITSVALGNVTILVAGLIAWGYVGRSWIAGGIGLVTKLTPGAVGGLDGLRGLVGTVLVGLAAAVVTYPLVGHEWPNYATAMVNARPFCDGAIAVGCLTSPTIALGLGVLLTLGCLLTSSRLIRLALVTAALLVTSMELQMFDSRLVYAYPLVVAWLASRGARPDGPRTDAVVGATTAR